MFSIGKMFNTGLYFVKKNKSTLELVAGSLLIVGGVVQLVKDAGDIAIVNNEVAYDKAYKKEIDEVVATSETPTTWEEEDQLGRSRFKYTTSKLCEHSLAYGKVCWKSGLMIAGGLTLNWISHADLTKQLQSASLAAAANALAFSKYRENVRADVGAEKDYQYLTGSVQKTVEVKEDGTVVETTTPIKPDSNDYVTIPHSFYLDDTDLYTGNTERDRDKLEQALNTVNMLLHKKGVLTENEIRQVFWAEYKTIAGQSAGAFAQNKDGSLNYISIGLEDKNDATLRFLSGEEPNFLITLRYSDGKPLEDNIFADTRIHEFDWRTV